MARKRSMNASPRLASIVLLVMFGLYAAGRAVSSLPAIARPREHRDTVAYVRISGQPVSSVDFWGSSRPLVFPLVLKLTGQDFKATAALQVGFSILAWGLLAWMTVLFLRPLWLKPFAFGLLLLLSLDRHIAGWDAAMLTESLSISFLVLFIALGLWLLRGWHAWKVIVLCLAGLLLAFTRDTNAWLLLMLAGLLTLAVLFRWVAPRALLLCAAFTGIFLLSNADADLGGRWVFPLANLIGRRVLPDPQAVAYFESCGMPVSPALLDLAGSFANDADRALLESPELNDFHVWLNEHGKACYMRWLLFHPVQSARATWEEAEFLIAFPKPEGFFSKAFDPLLPVRLGSFLYFQEYVRWVWLGCTLGALAALAARLWRGNALWAAFVLLSFTSFPHLLLTWQGDAMAPQRHALSVAVQLYLAFWLLVILLADRFLVRKTEVPIAS